MKKYIYTLISLIIFFLVFWGGIVLTFLEGDNASIGFCLLITSFIVLYISNRIILNKINSSMLQVLNTLPLSNIFQLLFVGFGIGILINYGTYFFKEFEQHVRYANIPIEFLEPHEDPEIHKSVALDKGYNSLGHAIVHYIGAFLLLIVFIIQSVKLFKQTKKRLTMN